MDAIDQDITGRALRDQYLAAMGIQVWMPRGEDLATGSTLGDTSGIATATSKAVAPEAMAPETNAGERASEHAEVAVRKSTELSTQAPPAREAEPEAPVMQVKSASKVVAEDSVVPEFCLTAVLLPGDLLVVSDAPLGSGVQPRAHQVLLGEILVAMGFAAPAISEAPCFKWPLSQQVKADQGIDVAREAVGAYVSAQVSGHQPKMLLLLGEVSGSYLLPPERGNNMALAPVTCPVITCPGLQAMLERPGLKAQAWKTICEYLGDREQPGAI